MNEMNLSPGVMRRVGIAIETQRFLEAHTRIPQVIEEKKKKKKE